MLLPLRLHGPPTAIIILAGSLRPKYGGSTTSILLNVPGESASVVTCSWTNGRQAGRRRVGHRRDLSYRPAGTSGVLADADRTTLARFALKFAPPDISRSGPGLAMVVFWPASRCSRRCSRCSWASGCDCGHDLFSAERGLRSADSTLDGIVLSLQAIVSSPSAKSRQLETRAGLNYLKFRSLKYLLPTLEEIKACGCICEWFMVGFISACCRSGLDYFVVHRLRLEKAVSSIPRIR